MTSLSGARRDRSRHQLRNVASAVPSRGADSVGIARSLIEKPRARGKRNTHRNASFAGGTNTDHDFCTPAIQCFRAKDVALREARPDLSGALEALISGDIVRSCHGRPSYSAKQYE